MANPISFTILINNYNYGRFLGKAIDSALSQSWPHVQVVVVDDGSTDESEEVAGAYTAPNYLFLRKRNGGQNSAIAHGLRHVKGDYTIVLDSDDWLVPDACERLAKAIGTQRPNAVMYRLEKFDAQRNSVGLFFVHPFVERNQRRHVLEHGWIPSSPTSGNAYLSMFLQDAFQFVRHDTFSSDGYLAWAAGWTESVVYVNEALAGYLIHGANASMVSGNDTVRRYKNNNYALDHSRHLRDFLEAHGEVFHLDDLVGAYVWREILYFKLTDGRYTDFSWSTCRRLGVVKFGRARHLGAWKQAKNIAFLVLGSWLGSALDVIRRPQ